MRRIFRSARAQALLLPCIAALFAVALPVAAQLPPDAEWRTFDTNHFRVHFTPGIEPLARRAAVRAERAYALLADSFIAPPAGKIDLTVADNVDFANGYATEFPTNRIVIYAHPPADEPSLSAADDWLELLVLHELVHIFHLDHARGIWRPLRSVFGRSPYLFPQLYVPGWVTEGLATYFESRLTGAGRVGSTAQEMALRTAILGERFFPISRATGDPATWPGGSTRYIYGSEFLANLAERHGPERITEWTETVGRRLVPYRVDAAARTAFGTSFTRAWADWRDSLDVRYAALADSLRAAGLTEPEILTPAGRWADFPRFGPAGNRIAYAAATGREQTSTRLILSTGDERVLAPRHTLGPTAWFPDGQRLLFAQLQFEDPYRVFSDLYILHADGRQQRLTNGARLWQPDLAPDNRRAAAITDADGTNVPVLVELESGATRPLRESSLDVHWATPRWSPGGDRIALGRWTTGGFFDVVVLDTTGTVLREITSDRAVDNTPAWSPDARYVLFASDRTGISNLFAYDWEANRLFQVTNVLTGAFQPDVSPDGQWIAFSFYQPDGFHIARIPFDPSTWRPAPPLRSELAIGGTDSVASAAQAGGPSRPYSPWPSLAPASWSVVATGGNDLGIALGAATAGTDVVGRHRWGAEGLVYTDGPRFEGGLAYRYRGLGNPVLDFRASQEWSVAAAEGTVLAPDSSVVPSAVFRRERQATVSARRIRQRWRSTAWAGVGGDVLDRALVWEHPAAASELNARLADIPPQLGASVDAGFSTVRGYSFSVSPEDGFLLSSQLEGRRFTRPRAGEEAPRGYLRLTGDGRAFRGFEVAGFARHVLALRVGAGAESGSVHPGFSVGGASGADSPFALDFDVLGRSLSFPIRGYDEGVQFGDRAVSATAEYRFPLLLLERGIRALPFYLDRLWGDVFADAGGAWCAEGCERRFRGAPTSFRPLTSVGAELNLGLRIGYAIDLPLRFGVAVPLRASSALAGTARSGPEFYVRLGRSF